MVVVGIVDGGVGPQRDPGEGIRVYVPYATLNTGVIARTRGPAAPHLNEMRSVVAAEAPQMPIARAETLEQREARFRRSLQRTGMAAAAGGLVALLLSAIGLYAVVSFSVGSRRREIGIRTALGAPRDHVVRVFFLRGLALSALGLVLGLPLSVLAIRLAEGTLGWSLSSPPLIFVTISGGVLAVASIAVWIPARRAREIDLVMALRSE